MSKTKKISVCGKGGSGKSVVTMLLANELRSRGYRILIVDSDESNSGLFRMLGFDHSPIPLMELAGGRKSVRRVMKGEFPRGEEEGKMQVLAQDEIWVEDIPSPYIVEADGLRLVAIGKILQFLEGCACPIGVLSREFLGRLQLRENELAIVDMEAGIEHFGRGVEESIDSVLIVVEPSFESLYLAERINNLAKEAGMDNIWCILNKTTSGEIALRLKKELEQKGIDVLNSVSYDPEVFQSCLDGGPLSASKADGQIKEILDHLI